MGRTNRRYFCHYCNVRLTHDTASVRNDHNVGYKHKASVRNYYEQFLGQDMSLYNLGHLNQRGRMGPAVQSGAAGDPNKLYLPGTFIDQGLPIPREMLMSGMAPPIAPSQPSAPQDTAGQQEAREPKEGSKAPVNDEKEGGQGMEVVNDGNSNEQTTESGDKEAKASADE